MAARFKRSRRGGYECRLDPTEITVLRRLLDELLTLLACDASAEATADPLDLLVGIATDARPPSDPVLARLLPDAYADDADAAVEFRRFTETSLRSEKAEAARQVLADLAAAEPDGRVRLDETAARVWLTALNDLRLALGTQLEITEQSYEELERLRSTDPRAATFAVYSWLGWLLETLVRAMP